MSRKKSTSILMIPLTVRNFCRTQWASR